MRRTFFPACCFAHRPSGGVGTACFRQILCRPTSDIANSRARWVIGFDQTSSYRSARVNSRAMVTSPRFSGPTELQINSLPLAAVARQRGCGARQGRDRADCTASTQVTSSILSRCTTQFAITKTYTPSGALGEESGAVLRLSAPAWANTWTETRRRFAEFEFFARFFVHPVVLAAVPEAARPGGLGDAFGMEETFTSFGRLGAVCREAALTSGSRVRTMKSGP